MWVGGWCMVAALLAWKAKRTAQNFPSGHEVQCDAEVRYSVAPYVPAGQGEAASEAFDIFGATNAINNAAARNNNSLFPRRPSPLAAVWADNLRAGDHYKQGGAYTRHRYRQHKQCSSLLRRVCRTC